MDACPLNDVEIMGGEGMFDLEEQLGKWRSQLASNEAYQESDIHELESHLVEEIDNLKKNDLSEEEAFWIARSRIGSTDILNQEFKKINSNIIWKKRLLWFLGGYLLFTFIHFINKVVTSMFLVYGGSGSYSGAIIFATVNLILLTGVTFLFLSPKIREFFIHNLPFVKRFKRLKNYQIVILLSPIMLAIFEKVTAIQLYIADIPSYRTIVGILDLLAEPIWLFSLFIIFLVLSLSINKNEKRRFKFYRLK